MKTLDTIASPTAKPSEARSFTQHPIKHTEKVYSLREIWSQGSIYWCRSYKTHLKYVHVWEHILKPIKKGRLSATRYYITETNVKKLVRMFENNELN